MASKFDVSQQKGLMAFNGFMGSKSYVEGYQFSPADSEVFAKMTGCPDMKKAPHAYRWYVHIAAISGVRGLSSGGAAAPAAAPAKKEKAAKKDKKKEAKKPAKKEDDDDDFDVFGDDDDEEEDAGKPKETRAEMLERLKKEANDRLIAKAAKQRTMVAIEVKPWDTEQDLNQLWKKITTEITQEGVKWGENCHLVEVAFGIKKICMSFVMGANNSSDEIIEQIEALEDEVQSVEMTSMNVL
jgi:elongation factor 1-beta